MIGSRVVIRHVVPGDLEGCVAVEGACYGPEGATRERIEQRIALFPEGFLVAEEDGTIAGLLNSAATNKEDITDEAFKDMVGHEPEGHNLVIFSLAVSPPCRGRGISRMLMSRFLELARRMDRQNVLLLCQLPLIPYYERYGFSHLGPSRSTHGSLSWHEMRLYLGP